MNSSYSLKNIEKDKCVSCGKDSFYTKDVHVDLRKYYVEGAGQLCKECHNRVYNK